MINCTLKYALVKITPRGACTLVVVETSLGLIIRIIRIAPKIVVSVHKIIVIA